jgi:hypothetical protein
VHESAAEAAAGRAGPAAEAAAGPAGHSPDHGGGSAPHHGIDVGWLAACLGLVAAATALGHPDATRRIAGRGRARIGTMFRLASRGN